MDNAEVSYQNIDVSFSRLLTVFRDYVLDFLGLNDLPPIERELDTKLPNIFAKDARCDKVFQLANGDILHIEDETDLSEADLLRFAGYDLLLYGKHKCNIYTVVLTRTARKRVHNEFNCLALQYHVTVIDLSSRDGAAVCRELRERIAAGEPANPLELASVPLMSKTPEPAAAIKAALDLAQNWEALSRQYRRDMLTCMLVMSVRFVDGATMNRWLEGIHMSEDMKLFVEKMTDFYRQEGRQEATRDISRETALLMLHDNEPMARICRYSSLPLTEVRALAAENGLTVREQ